MQLHAMSAFGLLGFFVFISPPVTLAGPPAILKTPPLSRASSATKIAPPIPPSATQAARKHRVLAMAEDAKVAQARAATSSKAAPAPPVPAIGTQVRTYQKAPGMAQAQARLIQARKAKPIPQARHTEASHLIMEGWRHIDPNKGLGTVSITKGAAVGGGIGAGLGTAAPGIGTAVGGLAGCITGACVAAGKKFKQFHQREAFRDRIQQLAQNPARLTQRQLDEMPKHVKALKAWDELDPLVKNKAFNSKLKKAAKEAEDFFEQVAPR